MTFKFEINKFIIILALFSFLPSEVLAQLGGVERRFGTSNSNNFSYQIESTIGTQTSATVSGNLRANTESILKLKSGGKITNKIGDGSGNASATFTASPNGANVNLSGISGENIFMIDDGTLFKSTLTMPENFDPSISSTGQASSLAIQNTKVNVEKSQSSFISSFQQSF